MIPAAGNEGGGDVRGLSAGSCQHHPVSRQEYLRASASAGELRDQGRYAEAASCYYPCALGGDALYAPLAWAEMGRWLATAAQRGVTSREHPASLARSFDALARHAFERAIAHDEPHSGARAAHGLARIFRAGGDTSGECMALIRLIEFSHRMGDHESGLVADAKRRVHQLLHSGGEITSNVA
jgi:hypothetical protein